MGRSNALYALLRKECYIKKNRASSGFTEIRMKSRKTVKEFKLILKDFSLWCAIDGIAHVGHSGSIFITAFWTIVLIAVTGVFFYQLIFQLIHQYLSYPVNVNKAVS